VWLTSTAHRLAHNSSRGPEPNERKPPAASLSLRAGRSNLRVILVAAALAALIIVTWLMRRRIR